MNNTLVWYFNSTSVQLAYTLSYVTGFQTGWNCLFLLIPSIFRPPVVERFCAQSWQTGGARFNSLSRWSTQPSGIFRCFLRNSRKYWLGSLRKTSMGGGATHIQSQAPRVGNRTHTQTPKHAFIFQINRERIFSKCHIDKNEKSAQTKYCSISIFIILKEEPKQWWSGEVLKTGRLVVPGSIPSRAFPFGVFRGFLRNSCKYGLVSLQKDLHGVHSTYSHQVSHAIVGLWSSNQPTNINEDLVGNYSQSELDKEMQKTFFF